MRERKLPKSDLSSDISSDHFLNVSCPPHQIGAMGERLEKDVEVSEKIETAETEAPQETTVESEPEVNVQNDSEEQELENPDVVQPPV